MHLLYSRPYAAGTWGFRGKAMAMTYQSLELSMGKKTIEKVLNVLLRGAPRGLEKSPI